MNRRTALKGMAAAVAGATTVPAAQVAGATAGPPRYMAFLNEEQRQMLIDKFGHGGCIVMGGGNGDLGQTYRVLKALDWQ